MTPFRVMDTRVVDLCTSVPEPSTRVVDFLSHWVGAKINCQRLIPRSRDIEGGLSSLTFLKPRC
ncbi:hypothetical protein RSAG8_10542, partial [Rhizoctonia solani AG-8 WAC10335]